MKIRTGFKRFIAISLTVMLLLSCSACGSNPRGNRNPKNDIRLDDAMRESLSTLKRIDPSGMLYEMDVSFDYYGDAMMKIAVDENFINHEHGCTAFMTYNENDEVIACRNFDTNHRAKNAEDAAGIFIIYHCRPEGKYRSIGIGDAKYFGPEGSSRHPGDLDDGKTDVSSVIYGIYDTLDGMNEKGLTVSTLSSDLRGDESCYAVFTPGQETCVTGTLMRYMLDECATVDEAVELAGNYNVKPYNGSKKLDRIFISDASGASKIIEWRYDEIRVTDTDIATNFYQTWDDSEPHKVKTSIEYENDSQLSKTYKNYRYGYGHGYERFNIVASTLQQYAELDGNGDYRSRLTNELARNLLSLVAQQMTPEMTSMTQYSVIYNSSSLSADIWLSRDYSVKYSIKIRPDTTRDDSLL